MTQSIAFSLLLLVQGIAHSAPPVVYPQLPPGTPIWVKCGDPVSMRVGQPVKATLVYPVFAENMVVLPAGTAVQGTIVALQPDKPHRLQARLRGDFTPFSHPVVQFTDGTLANGTHFALPVGPAAEGSPVMQLTPPPPRKGGFIRREFDTGVTMVKDRLRVITAPGKKERLKQLLYSQLPYHPQQISAGTVWSLDTTSAFDLQASGVKGSVPAVNAQTEQTAASAQGEAAPVTWTLQAYLPETISSAEAKAGHPIRAVVAEPVLDPDGAVAVPQGAVLQGEITHARAARRFGRAGELRFDFRQLTFPGSAQPEQVQTTLTGLSANAGANLALDREGKVQPKPQDRVIVPFILLELAGRPLDRDRGDNAFGKDAVASNSLGVLGFIVGTAAGWRNVAAGIGYYGSALAIWNRWIKRGQETVLHRDTRLVVQTTARRSAPLPGTGNERPPMPRE
jgi:hypothetical protein